MLVAGLLAVIAYAWLGSSAPQAAMYPCLLFAMALAIVLTPFAMFLSYRLRMLDVPDERKQHAEPVPLLGGPVVLLSFAAAAMLGLAMLPKGAVSPELQMQFTTVVFGGVLVAAIGVIDDRWRLGAAMRLVVQVVLTALVMGFGVTMTFLPPGPWGRAGEWVLTLLWVVGITNAMNFLDGLDGLAAGVSAVAALSFGIIAAITGQTAVAVMSFCVAGAALGFLMYNFRPARIYLGDSGATFLGFTLACIGLMGDWGAPGGAEGLLNLFVPVIILGIPIYDTIYITIYRVRTGAVRNLRQWAEYVGHDHLHHRLQHLGMRPARACLFICLGGVVLGVLAVIVKTKGEHDQFDKFLVMLVTALLFVGATILMELGKARHRRER
jgi:UDP-GlcNAc:undecaprenyl-phosphate/decaprenyl-phosphate GlcNAc-1-phosphate transferase